MLKEKLSNNGKFSKLIKISISGHFKIILVQQQVSVTIHLHEVIWPRLCSRSFFTVIVVYVRIYDLVKQGLGQANQIRRAVAFS